MTEDEGVVNIPKTLKKCPACGWIGVTSLVGCFRRGLHPAGEMVLMIDIKNDHYGRLT